MLVALGAMAAGPPPEKPAGRSGIVYVIPLHEMVDSGLLYSARRRVVLARREQADLIVFEINSYGGLVDAGRDLAEMITGIGTIKTVGYVPTKAISAGALIAMACDEIAMGPTAFLGDCEPILISPTGETKVVTAPEKFQTDLRARFRAYAERNGYPVALAQSMVTKELEVWELTLQDGTRKYVLSQELESEARKLGDQIAGEQVVVRKGELLTMTTQEAAKYGFCKHVASDLAEVLRHYGMQAASIRREEVNWSEQLTRFLDAAAPFLLAVALIALYIELNSPGFGVPGIVAVCCFATVFSTKYLAGLAESWEILVFVLGAAMLGVEVFVTPGFGVLGATGLALMAASLLLMFQDFNVPSTPWQWAELRSNVVILVLTAGGATVGMLVVGRFLPQVPVLNRLVLSRANIEPLETEQAPPPDVARQLLGKRGECLTMLRPAGSARVDGKTLRVMSEGEFIERGAEVEIIQIEGNRITVRKIPEA